MSGVSSSQRVSRPKNALKYVRIDVNSPSQHEAALFTDFRKVGRKYVYGVELFRFTAPVSGGMVAVLDLHGNLDLSKGEYGVLPIEEVFVQPVHTVPYYSRNRLMAALAIVGDLRAKLEETGSVVDEEYVEVDLLDALYAAFVASVDRTVDECATEDLKTHIRDCEKERLRKAREIITLSRRERHKTLERRIAKCHEALRDALNDSEKPREILKIAVAPLFEKRTPTLCDIDVVFHFTAANAIHVECMDQMVLKLNDSELDIFDLTAVSNRYTVITTSVSSVENARRIVHMFYFDRVPDDAALLFEAIPLVHLLACPTLLRICVERACLAARFDDLGALCRTARMVGQPACARLLERASELLRIRLREDKEFVARMVVTLASNVGAFSQLGQKILCEALHRPLSPCAASVRSVKV